MMLVPCVNVTPESDNMQFKDLGFKFCLQLGMI